MQGSFRLAPDVIVDLDARRVHRSNDVVRLTSRESDLLSYLVDHAGSCVTREALEREVWGFAPGVRSSTVPVTVRRLRAKLENDPSQPRLLHTVTGVGWLLVEPMKRVSSVLPVYKTRGLPRTSLNDELDAAMHPGRLVTLHGAGGAGKTRLAVSFAERWLGEVVFVPLLEREPGADLASFVLQTVGVENDAGLFSTLAHRDRVLIVFDNAEHVLEPLTTWLRSHPSLPACCLVTSREALRLPHESIIAVPELTREERVTLFGWRTSDSLLESHALFDWLQTPLAIELAAASGVSADHWVQQLDEDRLPATSFRGVPPTHRSLRRVIERSWSALPPREQEVLCAVAWFSGPIEPRDLEARFGALVHDSLLVLAEQSLLQNREGWALSPVVRAFVRQASGPRVRPMMDEVVLARVRSLRSVLQTDFERVLAEVRRRVPDLLGLLGRLPGNDRAEVAWLLRDSLRWVWAPKAFLPMIDDALAVPSDHTDRLRLERVAILREAGSPEAARALFAVLEDPGPGRPLEQAWLAQWMHSRGSGIDLEGRVEAALQGPWSDYYGAQLASHLVVWGAKRGADVSRWRGELERRWVLEQAFEVGRAWMGSELFIGHVEPAWTRLSDWCERLDLPMLRSKISYFRACVAARTSPEEGHLRFLALLEDRTRAGDVDGIDLAVTEAAMCAYYCGRLESAEGLLTQAIALSEPGSPGRNIGEAVLWAVRTARGVEAGLRDASWSCDPVAARNMSGSFLLLVEAEDAAASIRADPSDVEAHARLRHWVDQVRESTSTSIAGNGIRTRLLAIEASVTAATP